MRDNSLMRTIQYTHNECMIFDNNEIGKTIFESNMFELENKKYPGVTKVLSATKDMSGLLAWRERVGDEEADRIVNESTMIGRSLDSILYEHFKGTDCTQFKNDPGYRLYLQLKNSLRKIDPIALQLKVWSDKLQVMGYIDCLCMYDGKLTLLDFKNSRTPKSEQFLEDYYLQCTLYCMMLKDMFDINVKQIVLLIAVRSENFPQIKREVTGKYVKEALSRVSSYRRTIHNNNNNNIS